MKIDRSHAPWFVFVAVATAAGALLFTANFFPQRLPFSFTLPASLGPAPPLRRTFGGTPLGLIFGAIAFLIFLFASALGIRKKKRTWPIGSVQSWLRAHIWLTILTIPLVLFHCGFHSGGGQTTWLMLLYGVVMASGFFGLALQQFMPGLMRELIPREVVFEEIPHLRGLLVQAATRMRDGFMNGEAAFAVAVPEGAAGTSGSEDPSFPLLTRFLGDECIPYLSARRGERHRLGDRRAAASAFRTLKLNVDPRWQPQIDEMEKWCGNRRLMDLQTKLQHWLHGWLLVHVPASFALLVFTAWHAFAAVSFLATPN